MGSVLGVLACVNVYIIVYWMGVCPCVHVDASMTVCECVSV